MKDENTFDLSGKVAIITGASRGIGQAIAHAFARHGAKVIVSSRSQESVEQVATEIGPNAIGVACHVGREESLKALVETTMKHFGGVDILVNNAATNPVFGPLVDADSRAFEKIMDVNVKACMTLANLCHPIMRSRGGGSIINISSVEGTKPSPGLGMYSMSKAALIMLSKCQAKEWGVDNIRSNTISPGLIKTKFSSAIWQDEKTLSHFTQGLPLQRMGASAEIAGLAVYLASSAAAYTTGSDFKADGGYLIG